MSLLCLKWGLEGADGCWVVMLLAMLSPVALPLLFASATWKPSRAIPVAVMAAQACLIVALVVLCELLVVLVFCPAGLLLGFVW